MTAGAPSPFHTRSDALTEHLDGDPLEVLRRWTAEAQRAGVVMPAAMTLATTDGEDPHARTVAVTGITDRGLTFHSSTPTTKSSDLRTHPRASGVFLWTALGRQAVVLGTVTEQDREVTERAFPTRPRQLQLLAWVYEDLGQDLADPTAHVPAARIAERMAAAAERDPATLPPPPSWTTFVLSVDRVDLWQAGTEVVAPTKTRFLRASDGTGPWERREALP